MVPIVRNSSHPLTQSKTLFPTMLNGVGTYKMCVLLFPTEVFTERQQSLGSCTVLCVLFLGWFSDHKIEFRPGEKEKILTACKKTLQLVQP